MALSVPAFSSLPGSNHTIYLDFDGHVTSGTTWNTGYYGEDPITSPAWSLDSDRTNFSDAELSTIQRIWQRVAEDFSPFNINVTTVEPPIADLRKGEVTGDTKWGVRAVVTVETTTVRCGCGGIAYIGSFNDLYDEPVFIYNNSETGVAEAISHEVGHSLYLSHDGTNGADLIAGTSDDVGYYQGHGTGATSWAPIMGVGYYKNVTTWDRGEYYNTNNGGTSANNGYGPDDLSIITTKNGFTYKADEAGGTTATAAPLGVAGAAVNSTGVITTRTDVDVFSFTTGAGAVTLNVNPAALSPNLDIQADLLDAAGNVLTSVNPVDALNATISQTLAAGTYYLRIDGVGVGDPTSSTPTGYTDYASIGQYSITGSIVDPGTLPSLSVSDVTISESGGSAVFSVSINGSYSQNVTVNFNAADGTAVVGSDYSATSGSLTFIPGGPTSQTVSVPIVNDGVSEPAETFNLQLSGASANALIADATGVGTITNDDASLTINDTSVTEGNVNKRGVPTNVSALFSVSLAHPVNRPVSLTYATTSTGYTATAGVDYQSASGSLSIPAGQTSGSITVTVIGDNTAEPNETFGVLVTSTDTVADGTGVGTIIDNDSGTGGGGKGGTKGVAAANYFGDFTMIDSIDIAEPGHEGHDHGLDHGDGHESSEFDDGMSDDDYGASVVGALLAGRTSSGGSAGALVPSGLSNSAGAVRGAASIGSALSSDAVDAAFSDDLTSGLSGSSQSDNLDADLTTSSDGLSSRAKRRSSPPSQVAVERQDRITDFVR